MPASPESTTTRGVPVSTSAIHWRRESSCSDRPTSGTAPSCIVGRHVVPADGACSARSTGRVACRVGADRLVHCSSDFRSRDHVELGASIEDVALEARQGGWGVGTEVIAKTLAVILEDAHGIGRTAAAVQREHQLAARALGERVGRRDLFQLADELDMEPHTQLRLDVLLDRDTLELLEPDCLRARKSSPANSAKAGPRHSRSPGREAPRPPTAHRHRNVAAPRRRAARIGTSRARPARLTADIRERRTRAGSRRHPLPAPMPTIRGSARSRFPAPRARRPAAGRPTGCRRADRPRQ